MDHINLLNQVRNQENINLAFNYALHDRKKNDSYFDHVEIEYFTSFKDKIIEEINEELEETSFFRPRSAYAYYLQKNNLCYRRMIYLPFKDLVIRYAFVIILANHLDKSLVENCFGNRRASEKQANDFLLEDYYNVSLREFRNWQKKCADKYEVLIRTDISSFYDSISHQYLLEILARQLSISVDTPFLQLFSKLLKPEIISYSHKTKKLQIPQTLGQGLTIGNNLEGFLANLYLRDVDEAMQDSEIEFGRYNDDMRIFANNIDTAHSYLLILQENLLKKGLNLNASKTKIAPNKKDIEKLRTKLFDEPSPGLYNPYSEFQDTEESKFFESNEVEKNIDKEISLDDLLAEFDPESDIKDDKDAKNFRTYIQNHLDRNQRKTEHIEKLKIILTNFQGTSKQAPWLIVESSYYKDVPEATRKKAMEELFYILESNKSSAYTKYRIIHHLINLRKTNHRIVNKLDNQRKKQLKQILLNSLKEPAFELNIIALYALKILGDKLDNLKSYVKDYISKPLGDPIINTIYYLEQLELNNPNQEVEKNNSSPQSEQEYLDESGEREEFY
jgi:Reverse transcriptase (RNA-dependent DNA polymerase)